MCLTSSQYDQSLETSGRLSSCAGDRNKKSLHWHATTTTESSSYWQGFCQYVQPKWYFLTATLPVLLKNLVLFLLSNVIMAPGTLRMGWYYWVASNRQTFRYAPDSIRQRLDVYASACGNKNAPTVLFFYGGAWIIGYKLFGTLLARTLTRVGITVVIADYRNYPQACIPAQVDDVEAAVQWALDHVAKYGGDPDNLIVAGESAGGHLMFMALLRRALGLGATKKWNISDIKGVIAMATPLHFQSLVPTLEKQKWDRNVVQSMFAGQFDEHDPYALLLQRRQSKEMKPLDLPPIRIFHGTHDRTIPLQGVQVFYNEIVREHGVEASLKIYPGFTHIRANVQGPMSGDYTFQRDVYDAVQEWTGRLELAFPDSSSKLLQPFCPDVLVQLGTEVMPF